MSRIVDQIQDGRSWQDIFPGVASLHLDTEGTGLAVSVRLTKKEGEPVQLVAEGTPGATVVAVRKINELGYYNLSLKDLAKKTDLTGPRTLALVRHLKLQESHEYFKEFIIGTQHHKRYSSKALNELQQALPNVEMDAVWKEYGSARKKGAG